MRNKKMTKVEAIKYLVNHPSSFNLGDGAVVIGTYSKHVRFTLEAPSVVDEYSRLRLTIVSKEKDETSYFINITKPEYAPDKSARSNPALDQGGHYWGYDGEFYNWTPVPQKIWPEIKKILCFHQIGDYK